MLHCSHCEPAGEVRRRLRVWMDHQGALCGKASRQPSVGQGQHQHSYSRERLRGHWRGGAGGRQSQHRRRRQQGLRGRRLRRGHRHARQGDTGRRQRRGGHPGRRRRLHGHGHRGLHPARSRHHLSRRVECHSNGVHRRRRRDRERRDPHPHHIEQPACAGRDRHHRRRRRARCDLQRAGGAASRRHRHLHRSPRRRAVRQCDRGAAQHPPERGHGLGNRRGRPPHLHADQLERAADPDGGRRGAGHRQDRPSDHHRRPRLRRRQRPDAHGGRRAVAGEQPRPGAHRQRRAGAGPVVRHQLHHRRGEERLHALRHRRLLGAQRAEPLAVHDPCDPAHRRRHSLDTRLAVDRQQPSADEGGRPDRAVCHRRGQRRGAFRRPRRHDPRTRDRLLRGGGGRPDAAGLEDLVARRRRHRCGLGRGVGLGDRRPCQPAQRPRRLDQPGGGQPAEDSGSRRGHACVRHQPAFARGRIQPRRHELRSVRRHLPAEPQFRPRGHQLHAHGQAADEIDHSDPHGERPRREDHDPTRPGHPSSPER